MLLSEIYRRSQSGPRMNQQSFDLDVVYGTARLVREVPDCLRPVNARALR